MKDPTRGPRNECVTFVIPKGAVLGDSPWRCCQSYLGDAADMRCGCPKCLHISDLTLVWHGEDWDKDVPKHKARCRLASVRTARLFPERVCPGYLAYLKELN